MNKDKARKLFEERWPVPYKVIWKDGEYTGKDWDEPYIYLDELDEYRARFEGFLSALEINDPWRNVPEEQISFEDIERYLSVKDNGVWWISADTSCKNNLLASGYRGDPSRNGETRKWDAENGEWILHLEK